MVDCTARLLQHVLAEVILLSVLARDLRKKKLMGFRMAIAPGNAFVCVLQVGEVPKKSSMFCSKVVLQARTKPIKL